MIEPPVVCVPASRRAVQLTLPLAKTDSPAELFTRVFRRLELAGHPPKFQIEYRAFTSVRSTIRLVDKQAQVCISDMLIDAPPLVQEALAEILIARLYRRRPSREARECYRAYILNPAVSGRIERLRSQRAQKRLLPPRGRCFDLEPIFDDLNQRFFEGALPRPRLGWSTRPSRTVLGHYDQAHNSITISQRLDSAAVPRCAVEYLVFHEMLHMKYPLQPFGLRRIIHSAEFRRVEEKFPRYRQVRQAIRHLGTESRAVNRRTPG